MSNSVFQNVIVQLRDISDRVSSVIDAEGGVVSCTDVALLGLTMEYSAPARKKQPATAA